MTHPLVEAALETRGLSLGEGVAVGEGAHPRNQGVCPYARHCGEMVRKALHVA